MTINFEEPKPIKVRFKNQDAWYLPGGFGGSNNGPIAPLDHCDEYGNVLYEAILLDSLGHVSNGKVMVYGKEVGTLDDLLAGKL